LRPCSRFVELAEKYGFTKDGESLDSMVRDRSAASFDSGASQQRDVRRGKDERFEMLETTAAAMSEEKHMGLSFNDLREIFRVLDYNNDGSITHAEFIKGLRRNKGIARKLGKQRRGGKLILSSLQIYLYWYFNCCCFLSQACLGISARIRLRSSLPLEAWTKMIARP
jgi:hypothetical protein